MLHHRTNMPREGQQNNRARNQETLSWEDARKLAREQARNQAPAMDDEYINETQNYRGRTVPNTPAETPYAAPNFGTPYTAPNGNGCPGLQGPQGEQGPAGIQGPAGPAGPQGLKGDRGPEGAPGLNGLDGLPGAMGAQGPAGPQGPAGA